MATGAGAVIEHQCHEVKVMSAHNLKQVAFLGMCRVDRAWSLRVIQGNPQIGQHDCARLEMSFVL